MFLALEAGTPVSWARGSQRRYGTVVSHVDGTFGGTVTIDTRQGKRIRVAAELADVRDESDAAKREREDDDRRYLANEETRVATEDELIDRVQRKARRALR